MSGTSINLSVLNYVLNNWNKEVDVIQNDLVYAKFCITKDDIGGTIDEINTYVSISISDEIFFKVKLGKTQNGLNDFLNESNDYHIEDLFMIVNGEITIVRKGNI